MMSGLSRIQIYVLWRTLTAILVALLVISAVELLVDFVSVSRDVGARVDITPGEVLKLTLMKAPSVLLILQPFVFLFGTLAAFVGLNRRSELIAMRAAGISAWRFIFPAAAAAFVCGIVASTALNPVAASLSARYEQTRADLMKDYLAKAPKEVWLRQGSDSRQTVIHAKSRTEGANVVLHGVSVFFYTVDKLGVPQFERRVEAKEARLGSGGLVLTDVSSARPGGFSERSERLILPSAVRDPTGLLHTSSAEEVSFWDLPAAIRRAEDAGLTSTNYQLQLQQLLATPLLYSAMAVLAAAFSLRLIRLGGLAGLAGAGVALGFTFFFFNEVCGALGRSGIIPTFAAAWTPPVIALLSGLTLLCYTEDG
ncbi:MAG: lptG [Caulobacteraceae bacterium]|nr:lptG [Caulobacteraceae bacterium]